MSNKAASGAVLNSSGMTKRWLESIPASYTVWYDSDDAKYYAESNRKGGIDFPADPSVTTVTQNALDNLTGGRTWKEKVLLKGNFTDLDLVDHYDHATAHAGIQLSSYTILQIDGKIKLKNNANANASGANYPITNKNHTTGNTMIDIIGGEYDGNGANQGAYSIYGIELYNCSHSKVEGVYVHDTTETGIANEGGGHDLYFVRNAVQNTGYDGIGVAGSVYGGTNYDIHFVQNYITGTIPVSGIIAYREAYNVHMLDNIVDMTSTSTTGALCSDGAYDVEIIGNTVKNAAVYGIVVYGDDSYPARGVTIQGNLIKKCGGHGIFIGGTGHNTVTNCLISTNIVRESVAPYSGIVLDGSKVQYNQIINNQIFDRQTVPTQKYGIACLSDPDYNTFKNNLCYGHTNAPYAFLGNNNTYDGTVRTALSADLSGATTTLVVFHPEIPCWLARATLLYTEASSADAGITLEIGKESDRDYYYSGASETDKAQWYTKVVTLLQNDIAGGDTVTFYSPGGKAGTGEVMLILDYCTGA